MSCYEDFQAVLDDPMTHNEQFLMRMLRENSDTEYGRKYGFDSIRSVEEYQAKVPVTTYDDYVDYILRMTEDGEENLICSYPVNHYSKTSGTMGNPKRIPFSDESKRIYERYTGDYITELTARIMAGTDLTQGRRIMLMEAKPELATLQCGATYGAVSEKSLQRYRGYTDQVFTSPEEALFPEPGTNTRYLHARFALMDPSVLMMGGTFFSFFVELFRYIESEWPMLVRDIEGGTIDASVSLPPDVRKRLEARLEPMPERAAELRTIFSEGFDTPFVPRVWPHFAYATGTGSGSFEEYVTKLTQHFLGPEIPVLRFGVAASEGCMSVCYAANTADSVLVPDGMFYEFLPLDAGDDFSKIVTLDKVKEGEDYELIITNASGFYRYRMRDAVRVIGRYRNTPTIDFLYRIDKTVSIMGEKTTEVALQKAVSDTAKELDLDVVGYSMLPDLRSEPVCYRFFLEIADQPEDVSPKEIRFVLDQALSLANPSMGDKIKKGICGPSIINFLEPETNMLYRDLMVAKGTAAGQVKPVTVIASEVQRRFFNAMTCYSVEHYR